MPGSPTFSVSFDGKAYSDVLKVFDVCLELPSDSEKYFSLVVDEFSELVTLRINGEEIKQVSSTKFLGINIDSKLNWKHHIAYIQNKISKTTGILCKTRHYVSLKVLRMLYYALIYPYHKIMEI